MKNIIVLFILTIICSCSPIKNSGTKYSVTLSAVVGEDKRIEVSEDHPIEIFYELTPNKDSIDPWLKKIKDPKYGELKNCIQRNKLHIACMYYPDENFAGIDVIELLSGDGEIKGKKVMKVYINVKAVDDRPTAEDVHVQFMSDPLEEMIFSFDLIGQDIDTAPSDLEYHLVDQVIEQGGDLLSTKIHCEKKHCTYTAFPDEAGSFELFYYVSDNSNNQSEHASVKIDITQTPIEQTFDKTISFSPDKVFTGADLLWVIDNTSSMQSERDDLIANFSVFSSGFVNSQGPLFEYNMGVTTIDSYEYCNARVGNRCFDQNPYFNYFKTANMNSTVSLPNLINAFSIAATVSSSEKRPEKALSSVNKVLNTNSSFKKLNHLLAVVILSDENEQSTHRTISQWSNLLKTRESNSVDKFYTVTSLAECLDTDEPQLFCDKDLRYQELASEFGTNAYDIGESIGSILEDMSNKIKESISFSLESDSGDSRSIDLSSLVVTIDDVEKVYGQDFIVEKKRIYFQKPVSAGANITVKYNYEQE